MIKRLAESIFLMLVVCVVSGPLITGCATISNFTGPKLDYIPVKSMPAKDMSNPVELFRYSPETDYYAACRLNKYRPSVKSEYLYKMLEGEKIPNMEEYDVLGEFKYAIIGREEDYLTQGNIDQLYSKTREVGGDAILITSFRKTKLADELFPKGPYTVFGRIISFKKQME
ncbi:MAG: hypothetical protein ABIH89_02340 [Elusimicrobiota bacterium]